MQVKFREVVFGKSMLRGKNLIIQIVSEMGKNKAKFLSLKPKICPVARRSFAVLLSLKF